MKVPAGARVAAAAVLVAWIAFEALVIASGEAPAELGILLLRGTWGTGYGVGQVLYKATPLLFTGLAADVALRAGLFNVGGEGQLALGGLAAAVVGIYVPLPAGLGVVAAIGAAMAAGAAWAAGPAWLRTRRGTHEVIGTILANRVADAIVGWALATGLALAGTVRTPALREGARLPRLEAVAPALRGSAASFALVAALVAVVAVHLGYGRTRVGRELRLVGLGAEACRASGVPVAARRLQAMLLSGALAGAAASATVLGYKGWFEEGLGAGAGFAGLAVAVLGRGSPVGLVLAALLFGTLEQGGFVLNAHVPKELMTVLEAVVLLAAAAASGFARAEPAAAPGPVSGPADGAGSAA